LCRPGLVELYLALAEINGQTVELCESQEITRHASSNKDRLAQEAVVLFCSMLGSAAGNVALILGVKAGNQYSLDEVDYLPGVTEEDFVHDSWYTYGLGRQAMPYITAYSVSFLHTLIPGSAVLFGRATISLGIGLARK